MNNPTEDRMEYRLPLTAEDLGDAIADGVQRYHVDNFTARDGNYGIDQAAAIECILSEIPLSLETVQDIRVAALRRLAFYNGETP